MAEATIERKPLTHARQAETAKPEAWDQLRASNATNHDLRMPCCDAGVVLRTSKLGTRLRNCISLTTQCMVLDQAVVVGVTSPSA